MGDIRPSRTPGLVCHSKHQSGTAASAAEAEEEEAKSTIPVEKRANARIESTDSETQRKPGLLWPSALVSPIYQEEEQRLASMCHFENVEPRPTSPHLPGTNEQGAQNI